MSIRVLIADDHPVLRYGLRAFLNMQADIEIVGEASDGNEALEQAKNLLPDVVLLDVNMPGMQADLVIAALAMIEDPPQVLVLTAYGDAQTVRKMLQAGAQGFLLKGTDVDEIVEGIRAVANQKEWLSPVLTEIVGGDERKSKVYDKLGCLTGREQEVLCLISQGYNNSQVATRLSIANRTVRSHIENILNKLGAKNRTEAVVLASRQGWID